MNNLKASTEELKARALRAYFTKVRREGLRPQEPALASSGVEKHAGMHYVILRNMRGVLAVYRVRNDGVLKSLKRWPSWIIA